MKEKFSASRISTKKTALLLAIARFIPDFFFLSLQSRCCDHRALALAFSIDKNEQEHDVPGPHRHVMCGVVRLVRDLRGLYRVSGGKYAWEAQITCCFP